jgi:hypothetical protein
MTTAADDRSLEEAFEASLAGRPVPGEEAGLAAFTSAVRGTATQPGRPNAALADLLSTGLLTDQSSPSTRTAPAAGPLPSRSARSRTRRRFTVIVPALIAKFLSAGAIAQAATGAGVVVVVVTGAGTAGALPDDAQKTFSHLTGINEVVDEPADELTDAEETEPVEADDDLTDPTEVPDVPLTEPVGDDAEDGAEVEDGAAAEIEYDEWLEGPEGWKSFGAWVSFGKHRGWATGEIVSQAAHDRNDARKGRGGDDVEDGEEADGHEVEDGDDDSDQDEVEDESSDDDDGERDGDGNGKGRGGRG